MHVKSVAECLAHRLSKHSGGKNADGVSCVSVLEEEDLSSKVRWTLLSQVCSLSLE